MPLTRLHAWPLRRRLALLIGVSVGLTATVCLAAVLVSSLWIADKRAHELTAGITRMLSDALSAPVQRADLAGVVQTLGMLRTRPQIRGAWVQDNAGRFLGQYGVLPMPAEGERGGLGSGYLIGSAPVLHEGRPVGRLRVRAELNELHGFLLFTLAAIGSASLLAVSLSVMLGRRIARTISQPVGQLADTAEAIARSQDYSQRLPQFGNDEIGKAMGAVNHMLAELQLREEALLELRVADRTRELQSEKERAEAASRAKTSFLSHMSHELRTPLNAVIGAAQLLDERRRPDEDQAHLVAAIRDSGTRLLGLIDNILDLSRIESGALELLAEEFNLVDCIEAAMATAAVSARLKGLRMACIVSPALETWRVGDALRLRQVLLNLLGNAIKFTEHGEIVLRARPGAMAQDLHLQVQDSGIGMDATAQQQIFEPFRQADSSTTRRFGGSGLGLSITRRLVQAMGGHIGVSSRPGAGSCFELRLALPTGSRAGTASGALGLAVHYHEPHEASAEALHAVLLRLGCIPRRCTGVQDLEQHLQQAEPGSTSPWLMLALDDAQAGPMLEAARGRVDEQHLIGMMAAEVPGRAAMPGQLPRAARRLVQPVTRAALQACLAAPTAAGPAQPVPPQAPVQACTSQAGGALRVLVVEDDPLNQMIVNLMLSNAGHASRSAGDGRQALALLATQDIDLVLMDWQMPDMDGLEVTRRLRAGEAGPAAMNVPVIALTANAFTEDRAACLAAGMNDYLTKPVQAARLLEVMARWAPASGRAVCAEHDAEPASAHA